MEVASIPIIKPPVPLATCATSANAGYEISLKRSSDPIQVSSAKSPHQLSINACPDCPGQQTPRLSRITSLCLDVSLPSNHGCKTVMLQSTQSLMDGGVDIRGYRIYPAMKIGEAARPSFAESKSMPVHSVSKQVHSEKQMEHREKNVSPSTTLKLRSRCTTIFSEKWPCGVSTFSECNAVQ